MAQWDFVEWLLFWILETSHFEFEWAHEVEAVFRSGLALPLGIQISPVVNEQRLGLVGPTLNGKLLQIAFVMREGRVRVISARPAHKKERTKYEEILRKIT